MNCSQFKIKKLTNISNFLENKTYDVRRKQILASIKENIETFSKPHTFRLVFRSAKKIKQKKTMKQNSTFDDCQQKQKKGKGRGKKFNEILEGKKKEISVQKRGSYIERKTKTLNNQNYQ